MITPEHTHALNKAKIGLMQTADSAFFATICFSLKFKWDTTCHTAYTDGAVLGMNPDFFMGMSPEERIGVLVHESCHVAYLHMERLQIRDPGVFNAAADHVINLQLEARGFKLPAFRLADPRFIGMYTEPVYEILLAEKQQGTAHAENKMEDLRAPENSAQTQQNIQDILIRASLQSKLQGDKIGTISGEIQIYLDNLLAPKLPWYRILQKYLQALAKSDYSFRKPNRRFFPTYHLPSLHSEGLMDIAVAVDASGSVSDHDFKVFVSEVSGILRMMKPDKITLIQFDTEIKSVDVIQSIRQLSQVTFSGRGGTAIEPVLQWANEHKPQLLLVFTDGEFRFTDLTTKAPVLWLIHNQPLFTAPFGKCVHYTI